MKIVQRLGSVACGANERPLSDLMIIKAHSTDSSEVTANKISLASC